MKSPLISVCIVSYNHQAYIADCLASVLAQYGQFRLEIILGDDTSTDNTVSIVREMIATYRGEAVIRLFAHEKNLGPSQNYQFLIAQAKGDFIAHLDGDDFWLPGKLQAQLDFLLAHPDCPACYSNTLVMQDDKSHWGFFNRTQPERISLETLLSAGNFLNHSSLLYRANFKTILLAFPENFIDYRIHLALAQHGELGFINQVLVAYRINSQTSMIRLMRKKFILLYLGALLSIKESVPIFLLKTGLNKFLTQIFFDLWLQGKHDLISTLINQSQSIHTLSFKKSMIFFLIQSLLLAIKNAIYRRTWGYELRFLQRNHRK
jgi:glycosyltransferase involved in cell wall biosynthesis